ncbi:MAG: hypothetical protein ACC653_07715 [Gammaproteobacteria bacterium]
MLLIINSKVALAQVPSIIPGLALLTISDIRDSTFAFVNMSTSPGLDGAVISVANNERNSDQLRSSLGFNAEITFTNYIFNGYWGLNIVSGNLEDTLTLIGDNGKNVQLDITRELIGARGTIGLSFPINQHFKFRPNMSVVVSDLQTVTTIDDQFVADNNLKTNQVNTNADLLSFIISLDALYNRWYDDYNLELTGQYNFINTDAISGNSAVLDSTAENHTIQFKGMFSGPTDFNSIDRPWRWNTYANYTNFLSHNKKSLGYNSLLELGAGLDWQINIKPLNWFGWKSLGFKVGYIVGDNVTGYSIGLTAQ